jgi:hypothetical protein
MVLAKIPQAELDILLSVRLGRSAATIDAPSAPLTVRAAGIKRTREGRHETGSVT